MKAMVAVAILFVGCTDKSTQAKIDALSAKVQAMEEQASATKIADRKFKEEQCYNQPAGKRVLCLAKLDQEDYNGK